ncbi:MAG TPA: hypothetical protein VJL60_06045, partial [Gammaproteobacteria bacterium]|nr:hypothetical protein [Gammaproteobacteria bacterium]
SESDIAAPAGSLLGGGSLPTYTFYTPEEYHTQTLVPEDKLLKNLFKIYELNYYNLLKASEGQADLEAFNRLEEANKKIAALLLQITKLRVEKPAYAGGNDDTLAKKFLTQIKQDFVTLQKKMQRVSQTNTPQTHYRYFSSGFDEVSAHEHRTRLTNSNVDTHLPLAAGSADKPTIAALKDKTSAEVYRWHDKNPKHESSFFEYVKQGGIGSYEITIVDLPEAISDRGLLKIFLTQENLMRSGLESELRHLSPTLTKDKLIEFFKKQNISEGFFKTNASLADDFLKFAEKKRLTSTNRTTIPNEAIFIEAARILNTVLAAGQMPFQFDQANNIPLMTAIDMLVRLHEIEDKIMITAKNYQVTPSSAQLNIVNMLKNQKPDVYTLKVASVLEKTEALTKQLNSSP